MDALINIGLNTNTGGEIDLAMINAALDDYAIEDYGHRIEPSVEEATYIAHVANWSDDKAFAIAQQLEQDCIAQYDLSECKGKLVGPKAAAWREFEPRLFKVL